MPQIRVGHGQPQRDRTGLDGAGGEDGERVTVLSALVAQPHLVKAERLGFLDNRHQVRSRRVREQPNANGAHGAREALSLKTRRVTTGVQTNSIDMIEQLGNVELPSAHDDQLE